MTEIYTPEQWRSLFNCPSIVIDDSGYIYSADAYKQMFRSPIGKIDYSKNNIYGRDYSSIMATPIAYMVSNGDVTKVHEYGKSQFSDPILYIQKDKIYTPQEYTRLLGGTPSGYIKTEPGKRDLPPKTDSSDNSRTNSEGGATPGMGLASFVGVAVIVGIIYILIDEARIANAAMTLAVLADLGAAIYFIWKAATGKLRYSWNKKRFLKGLLSGVGVYVGACAVLVLLGLFSHVGTGNLISDSVENQMEIAAIMMGIPFVISGLFEQTAGSSTGRK